MVCLVASNFKDKTDNERLYLKGDVYSCYDDQRIKDLKEKGYLVVVNEQMTKKDIVDTLSSINIVVEDDKTKADILSDLE